MGYYSDWSGTVTLVPAMSRKDVHSIVESFLGEELDFVWSNDGMELQAVTSTGTDQKAYWLEENFRGLVEQLLAVNPEQKFNGTIEVFGEEPTDIWRIYVQRGKVVKETAEIRWPDGTVIEDR